MTGIVCAIVGNFSTAVAAQIIRLKKGITAVGNAQIDTAQSKFGGASALFDGTGDYVVFNPAGFTSSDNFTFEGWIRFNAVPTSGQFQMLGSSNTSAVKYFAYTNSGGTLRFETGVTGTSGTFYQWWNTTLSTNTWYHFAFVKNSTSLSVYVDGTALTSSGTSGSMSTDKHLFNDSIGHLGAWYNAASGVNGWMDEIRISNTARYTSNFTAPTTAFVNDDNTLLLIHANGTDASTFFEDDNGVRAQKGIVAIGNAQVDTAQSKFGGSSLLLDGVDDRLEIYPTTTYDDFTVECWIRLANNSGTKNILSFGNESSGRVFFAVYNDRIYWDQYGVTSRYGNTSMVANTWYHLAWSRTGSTIKLFVDGVEQTMTTVSGSGTFPSGAVGNTNGIFVGTLSDGAIDFNGHIDEIRVSNSVRYTTGFTAPTQPFVNDANTLLLIHADGTDAATVFRDDNGARAPKGITAVGNAQIDTAQSKFGGASALFDGTGDYLIVGNDVDSDMALTSTTWTVEYWARINAHAGSYQGTLGIWDPSGSTGSVWYITTNAYNTTNKMGISYVYGTNSLSGDLSFGSALSTGVWQHHAFVRNGNTLTAYLDGVSQGTHDMTGRTIDITGYNSSTNTTLKMTVGALTGGAGAFNGHLDEIRISNIARYTTGFTAPTAPFSNDSNTVLLIHADGTDASTVFIDDNGKTPVTP